MIFFIIVYLLHSLKLIRNIIMHCYILFVSIVLLHVFVCFVFVNSSSPSFFVFADNYNNYITKINVLAFICFFFSSYISNVPFIIIMSSLSYTRKFFLALIVDYYFSLSFLVLSFLPTTHDPFN